MTTVKHCFGLIAIAMLAGCMDGSDGTREDACADARRVVAEGPSVQVNYGFYTDFNPLSYAATQDPADPAFNEPLGYEPSLVAAIEDFSRGGVAFNSRGIGNPFSGIWLKAAQPQYDMIGGGITALPARTLDDNGQRVIRFGTGHVGFRQSLLVPFDSTISRHSDLNSGHVVAVLRDTTGESQLLALTGITDAQGYVRAGTRIVLADDTTLTAAAPGGEGAYRIDATGGDEAIATRVRLLPASAEQPEVHYFDDDAGQIGALLAGEADALARGEIGNLIVAQEMPGELRVVAVDAEVTEEGAFSYADTPAGDELRGKMDAVIRCLTDEGGIGFAEWLDSGGEVFMRRAGELR